MATSNLKQLIDAELEGRVRRYAWRKTPSQVTNGGLWFDLSMSPGNPPPKYWFDAPPAIAKQVSQSADGGIFHGPNVSPQTKYLRQILGLTVTATALPMTFLLCDYLMYYPSIDESTTDPQPLDNTVTIPRYTDGAGVQVIAVSVAGRTGSQQFNFSYTNSDGVAGRTSQTHQENTSTALGVVVTSGTTNSTSANPFIGLQGDDTGVRSIESVTMLGADVGLFALILVKPLAQFTIKEATAPHEKDFLLYSSTIPVIKDDAYLNFLCLPQGSLAATALIGDLKVVWN